MWRLDNLTLVLGSVFAVVLIYLVPNLDIVSSAIPVHAHDHPVLFLIKIYKKRTKTQYLKNEIENTHKSQTD